MGGASRAMVLSSGFIRWCDEALVFLDLGVAQMAQMSHITLCKATGEGECWGEIRL